MPADRGEEEVRDHFRQRTHRHEVVPLGVRREQFGTRLAEMRAMIEAA